MVNGDVLVGRRVKKITQKGHSVVEGCFVGNWGDVVRVAAEGVANATRVFLSVLLGYYLF